MELGLVSVSFRSLSPCEVIQYAKAAGLSWIEWGSDVHAPCCKADRIEAIAAAQRENALACCSYGTYFQLGVHRIEELPAYILAAKKLQTDVLRLWCGNKGYREHCRAETARLLAQCRRAEEIARSHGVTLCLECHRNTFTDELCGGLQLMEEIHSPHFRMYWQPNQYRTREENLEYARMIAPYTKHIHVFHWVGTRRYPLEQGADEWRNYLEMFPEHVKLLLEFMPDDRPESLTREAETLQRLAGV